MTKLKKKKNDSNIHLRLFYLSLLFPVFVVCDVIVELGENIEFRVRMRNSRYNLEFRVRQRNSRYDLEVFNY